MNEEISELVIKVNVELKNKSMASIEKELGYGKDTLRKKLNRYFYYLNKDKKEFIYNQELARTQALKHVKTHNNTSITHIDNTTSYNNNTTAYNPVKTITGGADMEKEKIAEFKALSTQEKIDKINSLTSGIKTLKEIEPILGFTNVGNYVPRDKAYWDKKDKIFKVIPQKEKEQKIFSNDEISILKEIISNYKNKKEIEVAEFQGEVVTRSFRSYKDVMEQFATFCTDNKLNQKDAIATALSDFIKKNN